MKGLFVTTLWYMLTIIAGLILATDAIYAHEGQEVGPYLFKVGFLVEPAFEGLKNGVELQVMKKVQEEDREHVHGHAHSEAPQIESAELIQVHTHGKGSPNLEEHGAIFSSPVLHPGKTFVFKVPQELEGLKIPYHSHLSAETAGSITVNDAAELSGTVKIEIRDQAFHPADITVKPETTLEWINNDSTPQTVTSGFHSGFGHTHAHQGAHETHKHTEKLVPVEGLENTLQVEVTHVSSGTSKTLKLRPILNDPGHYTADLIPTAPGQYRFRFFGTVEGREVNESFESGPGRFDDVQSAAELQFPEKLPSVREIAGVVRGASSVAEQAQDTALQARDSAGSASNLAIAGLILGAIGLISGVSSLVVTRRRR